MQWLIYGATGYSGQKIVEAAIKLGLKPTLAGRNTEKIKALADKYQLKFEIFDLKNIEFIKSKLQPYKLVLNCAGPFSQTCKSMVQACIRSRTHYLDITGEISVFEKLHHLDEKFKTAGITVIPGVGFDVVPTDCLANQLVKNLKDANDLKMAIEVKGGISPGTLKTMVEGFFTGSLIRSQGVLTFKKSFEIVEINFFNKKRKAILIPWGDLSTAYFSTKIPNIGVYLVTNSQWAQIMKLLQRGHKVLNWLPLRVGLQNLISHTYKGPSLKSTLSSNYRIQAWVSNESGESRSQCMTTPNGYILTADLAVSAAQKVLKGEVAPGYFTPAQAFGADFINPFLHKE